MVRERERKTLATVVARVREIFGERLISIAAYGSVLTDSYDARTSDINLLVVVRDLAAADLRAFRRRLSFFCRRRRVRPIFCTPLFVGSSADSFPLEWREIAARHEVLHGDDPFAAISVREEHLRAQIEREIKQNYLAFLHALAFNLGDADALRRSERSLSVLLRNAGGIVPPTVVRPSRMEKTRGSRRPATAREIDEHVAFLESLLQCFDRMRGS